MHRYIHMRILSSTQEATYLNYPKFTYLKKKFSSKEGFLSITIFNFFVIFHHFCLMRNSVTILITNFALSYRFVHQII